MSVREQTEQRENSVRSGEQNWEKREQYQNQESKTWKIKNNLRQREFNNRIREQNLEKREKNSKWDRKTRLNADS